MKRREEEKNVEEDQEMMKREERRGGVNNLVKNSCKNDEHLSSLLLIFPHQSLIPATSWVDQNIRMKSNTVPHSPLQHHRVAAKQKIILTSC